MPTKDEMRLGDFPANCQNGVTSAGVTRQERVKSTPLQRLPTVARQLQQ
jgi:hypothetical protein